jgi:hypothetical protein
MEPNEGDFRREAMQISANEDFGNAARQRWRRLGEELRADVEEFNSSEGGAGFSQIGPDQFYIGNSRSGLEVTITADFDNRIIRYKYDQLNSKSAGVPEGGMLAMRQSPTGVVELFSADERLTSKSIRKVLLQPVLFPPEMAA